MDFREPSVPLKGRGHSSVCNGSFLLKERVIPLNGTSDNIRNYDVSLDYIYAFSELILHILSFNYTHCSSIRENYTFHFYNQILKTEHFRLVFVLIIIF